MFIAASIGLLSLKVQIFSNLQLRNHIGVLSRLTWSLCFMNCLLDWLSWWILFVNCIQQTQNMVIVFYKLFTQQTHMVNLTRTTGQKLLFEGKHAEAIPAAMQSLRFAAEIYGLASVELVPSYLILGRASIGITTLYGSLVVHRSGLRFD